MGERQIHNLSMVVRLNLERLGDTTVKQYAPQPRGLAGNA